MVYNTDIEYLHWCSTCQTLTAYESDEQRALEAEAHQHVTVNA